MKPSRSRISSRWKRRCSSPRRPTWRSRSIPSRCQITNGKWNWIGAISLGSAGAPVVAEANGREVRLASGAKFPFPGGASATPPQPEGIIPVDFNYDFKTDLVLAGAGGVRLIRQESPSAFTDVTAQTKLPKSVTDAPYTGAWAVDIEADGDLDIVLGAKDGVPTVLRNNGDDTFLAIHPFTGISGLRRLRLGRLRWRWQSRCRDHRRRGTTPRLHERAAGPIPRAPSACELTHVKAIAVADANNDGILDLLAVQGDGAIVRISDKNEGQSWETGGDCARAQMPRMSSRGDVRLHVADLDNNGALDLILSPVPSPSAMAAAH